MKDPPRFPAGATRNDGWWTVTVDEVSGLFTQTRRLDQIEEMVRDALILFPEVEAAEEAIVIVKVDPTISHPADNARRLGAEADLE